MSPVMLLMAEWVLTSTGTGNVWDVEISTGNRQMCLMMSYGTCYLLLSCWGNNVSKGKAYSHGPAVPWGSHALIAVVMKMTL